MTALRACVVAFTAVMIAGCGPEHPTADVLSSKDMAMALSKVVSNGMPLTSAKDLMLKEGFDCENVVKGKWKKQMGVTFLLCKRTDGTPPVKRLWEVAVMHDGTKVTGLDLRSALVYP